MSIEEIADELAKRMIDVSVARDKLDDLISEANELRDSCQDAYDALWEARDALSRLV